jgi:hypothetical protein
VVARRGQAGVAEDQGAAADDAPLHGVGERLLLLGGRVEDPERRGELGDHGDAADDERADLCGG